MMKNANVASKLLPIIFAVSSLTAVACAAPTTESSAPTSEDGTPDAPAATHDEESSMTAADAVAKIPSNAMISDEVGPVALPDEAKALAPLQLFIPSLNITYPVSAFNFAVMNPLDTGAAKAGTTGSTGKAQFSSLSVHVMPALGTPSLSLQLFKGLMIDKIVLMRPADGKGKPADVVATFGTVAVEQMAAEGAGQSVNELYEFKFGTLEMSTPTKDNVKMNVLTNTSERTVDTCSYGPFVQAHESWTVKAPNVQVDRFAVVMSSESSVTSGSASAAAKAKLDYLGIDTKLNKLALCAIHDIHRASNLGAITFQVATHSQEEKLTIPYKWESCMTVPTAITIQGGGTEEIRAQIEFTARGIIRTNGKIDEQWNEVKYSKPVGWSFVNNREITTCSDITLPM